MSKKNKKSKKIKKEKIVDNKKNFIQCCIFSIFFCFLTIISFNIISLIFLLICLLFSVIFGYRYYKEKNI